MAKPELTAELLRELLHYDQTTGLFTRRVATGYRGCHKAGVVCGSLDDDGYVILSIQGWRYFAHRVAFLYMTGEWPAHQIDHEDTDKSNNRWVNLRVATDAQNKQNIRKAQSDNKCGLLGVCRDGGRWKAQIKVWYRNKHLGSFASPEQAHAAYLEAKARLHPFQTLTDVK